MPRIARQGGGIPRGGHLRLAQSAAQIADSLTDMGVGTIARGAAMKVRHLGLVAFQQSCAGEVAHGPVGAPEAVQCQAALVGR
jgi:hypothetical protein